MPDTMMPDREAELRDQIARLNRKIDEVKYEITRWQDELDTLEIERADLLEKLDEVEDASLLRSGAS